MFVKIPEKINTYFDKREKYLDTLTLLELEEFYNDLSEIVENTPTNISDCIKYSYKLWYKLFNYQIRDLIKQYPEDEVNDMGLKFWSGSKKFPQYEDWSNLNENHRNFILSSSILRSKLFNLKHDGYSINELIDNLNKSDIDVSYNESGKKIGSSEEEQKKLDQERMNTLNREQLCEKIKELSSKIDKKLFVNEFEKDDDTNYHIDFIHSFSNLRASNYRIEVIDRLSTKKIAGKIIPAIATTTSLVSGLVAIELIKIIKKYNKLSDFRNYFINLALPLFTFSEPGPVSVNSLANGKFKFTLWDSFDFKDMKLEELFNYFEKNYNINISMVNHGQKMLYSGFMNPKKAQDRKKMMISEILKEVYGKQLEDNVIEITLVGENPEQEDEDIELPVCKFYL
jgi:ubiquitin-activating enzyme E1